MLLQDAPRARFRPTQIPNCILWLAADRITGLADDDAVATWSDLSVVGNHATQANAGNRPVYKTGIVNGKPVVRFTGTSGALDLTSEPALTTEATIFIVASQQSAAGNTVLYGHVYVDGANYPRYALQYSSGQRLRVTRTNDAGTSFTANEAYRGAGNSALTLDTFYAAMAIYAGGLAKLYALDGAEQTMTWDYNGSEKIVTGFVGTYQQATIGAQKTAAYEGFLTGDIAEVIFYSRKLNYGERARVLRYLKRKYALATTLPPTLLPSQGRIGLGAVVTIINDGTYNAFPSMIRRGNGDLAIVYRGGAGGHNGETPYGVIKFKTSADNGTTWSGAVVIASEANIDNRDPMITRLANGDLYVTYPRKDWIAGTPAVGWDLRSTDDGATWSAPAAMGTYPPGGPVVQLRDGSLIFGTHFKIDAGDTYTSAWVHRSTDNGATWGAAILVANGETDGRVYWEPNLVQLGDGRLLILLRSDTALDYWKAYSEDGGLTWGPVTLAFDADGASANAPKVVRLRDGRLLVSTRSSVLRGAYLLSSDDGATWSAFTQLYSEGTESDNQEIVESGDYLDIVYACDSALGGAILYFKRGVLI